MSRGSFNNLAKDRVQVALTSEGRPVNAEIQLWLGPDWTPFSLKAYSEDGKLRPIQTLVGTRNTAAMIEVRNVGEYEFPFSAASDYAKGAMALLPQVRPSIITILKPFGLTTDPSHATLLRPTTPHRLARSSTCPLCPS